MQIQSLLSTVLHHNVNSDVTKLHSELLTQKYYNHIISEDLLVKHQYKTIMQIPAIKKIVINTSSKQISYEKKNAIPTLFGLELISGQKACLTRAKQPIATFKIRKGQLIGGKVVLRGNKKLFFIEKVIKILLPRLAEYSGTTTASFNKEGNFNIGIQDPFIFPELENFFPFFEKNGGLNICFYFSTKTKEESFSLLSSYQLPLIND